VIRSPSAAAAPLSAVAREFVLAGFEADAWFASDALRALVRADAPESEFRAGCARAIRAVARNAVARFVDSCWCGFDASADPVVRSDPDAAAFLALRTALLRDSAEWPVLAAAFLSGSLPFPDMTDAEVDESVPGLLPALAGLAALGVPVAR
jgi:hypothetical protein